MENNKEKRDKWLLSLEIWIGVSSVMWLLSFLFCALLLPMPSWSKVCLSVIGVAVFLAGMLYSLKIEQTAGYYKCAACEHKYVPTYKMVFLAPHIGRTRYMRCPECGQRTWNKKAL